VVSAHEFLFWLQLTDDAAYEDMLQELIVDVLDHVGYGGDAAAQLVDEMHGALAASEGCGPCDVRFRAHAGQLQIVIVHGGGEWQTTRPLP
jgi:hypothetical protein